MMFKLNPVQWLIEMGDEIILYPVTSKSREHLMVLLIDVF